MILELHPTMQCAFELNLEHLANVQGAVEQSRGGFQSCRHYCAMNLFDLYLQFIYEKAGLLQKSSNLGS